MIIFLMILNKYLNVNYEIEGLYLVIKSFKRLLNLVLYD